MPTQHADDLRNFNLHVAQTLAPTWARRSREIEQTAAPVRSWMIRELAPRPGQTILELAAGVGDTGFEAARLVGDSGRLISTDFAPAMVDEARRRGDELGLRNVEYRVMDAERLDLDTASVDGVLCRFGFMLMPDPAAALAEARRVLRPGGGLALAVWGPPERNPFFMLAGAALVRRGHLPPPDPEAPGPFHLALERRLTDLLSAAGFDELRVEEVPVRFATAGPSEYLDFTADTAGPLAMALRGLDDAARADVERDLTGAFAAFATGGGFEVPGLALVAGAR